MSSVASKTARVVPAFTLGILKRPFSSRLYTSEKAPEKLDIRNARLRGGSAVTVGMGGAANLSAGYGRFWLTRTH